MTKRGNKIRLVVNEAAPTAGGGLTSALCVQCYRSLSLPGCLEEPLWNTGWAQTAVPRDGHVTRAIELFISTTTAA